MTAHPTGFRFASPIFEKLGDIREQSVTLNNMFDICWQQEKHQEAFDAIASAFQLVMRMRNPDGVSVVGMKLGQVLLSAGDAENGCRVLRASREAYSVLGDDRGLAAVDALLAEHCRGAPEV